jgi:hypothetical protein
LKDTDPILGTSLINNNKMARYRGPKAKLFVDSENHFSLSKALRRRIIQRMYGNGRRRERIGIGSTMKSKKAKYTYGILKTISLDV